MKRIFSMAAALALCGSAAIAQYSDTLDGSGTSQTVTNAWSTDTISVGVNTPSNALYVVDGGMVTSTNVNVGMTTNSFDNEVVVSGTGTLDVVDTLQLGAGTNNAVTVTSGGLISVGNLVITNSNTFNLDTGGTFSITTNFDASMDGFNWIDGGHLSVGGELAGMTTTSNGVYLDGGRDLTIDGGIWMNGDQDLIVGYNDSDSTLSIINGGKVDNANGYIGWGTNSANNAVVVSGAESEWRNNGGFLTVAGTDNALIVSNQAWVYVGDVDSSEFTAGGTGGIVVASTNTAELAVDSGALVATTGSLIIGGSNLSMQGSVTISNNGTVSATDLILNSGSSILLDSGGSISDLVSMSVYSNATINGDGAIGFGETNASLAFYGYGTGTVLGSNIVFSANSIYSNSLSYFDGELDVSGFDPMQFENFTHLVLSGSDLTGTGTVAFTSIDMTDGTIDPAGEDIGSLRIEGDFSADGTKYLAQVDNSTKDELSFSDAVDLSGLSLELAVSGTTPGALTILSADGGLSGNFFSTNILGRPLLYTVDLQITNNEVQVVMAEDTSLNLSSALDYAATESVRAGFSGMKNMVFTRTKQLRRNLVSTTHAIPNEVYLLTSTNAPAGAMGPGDQNTIFDMHVWLQQYSGQGDYDRIGATDAFKLNNNGTIIGADKLIGEALAVGINYTYARSQARAANRDRLDNETYWFGAYAEWVGVEGLYIDALAAYGYSSYDSVRFAEDYQGFASYNGQAFGAYADVGQYYYYGNNLALSPYMGLHALSVNVDAHNEKELVGSELHVDQVDRSWLESVLGLKLRHRFDTPIGRFQTTGYAEWSYDFIQDDVHSTLSSGGLAGVETARVTPDESGINTGLGYSWICTDYLEIGIGYNGRFSDNYEEHTGSVMLDIMF